jgi:hypothetical protein
VRGESSLKLASRSPFNPTKAAFIAVAPMSTPIATASA